MAVLAAIHADPLGLLVAFGAGMLSFLSPCVLPLVPAYLSMVSGLTAAELEALAPAPALAPRTGTRHGCGTRARPGGRRRPRGRTGRHTDRRCAGRPMHRSAASPIPDPGPR